MGCGSSTATGVETGNTTDVKALHKKYKVSTKFIQYFYDQVQKVSSDGKITSSQFVDIVATSKDPDLETFLQQIFTAFTAENREYMTFEQLVMMLAVITQGSTTERLGAVFHICDKDRSGEIEKKELVDTFKNMFFLVNDENLQKDDMAKVAEFVFEQTDKDGNGHLTKDEFIKAFSGNEKISALIKSIFVAFAKAINQPA